MTAIRKFVDEGGGFIGVGEPTACQHQGRYFQLSDVMGVDREMGFSLSTDKYNTCDPHHFILEDIDTAVDFGEGTSRIYAQGKHYQILAQDGEYSQLVVNEYGKGHSVYFAGLPYSPQNCRILLRAIYYAAGMPEEMKHYYVTNVDTEVTVFPKRSASRSSTTQMPRKRRTCTSRASDRQPDAGPARDALGRRCRITPDNLCPAVGHTLYSQRMEKHF